MKKCKVCNRSEEEMFTKDFKIWYCEDHKHMVKLDIKESQEKPRKHFHLY